MNSVKIPLVFDCDAEMFRALVERVLAHYGCLERCELVFDAEVQGERVFRSPLRLGELLDHVTRRLKTGGQGDVFPIGSYRLDMAQGVLSDEAGTEIRLTDKECELLQILHHADGALVERDTLLAQIWGYAPEVETHTVETHVYRLRQKIEVDPADPKIVVTEASGYKLAR